MTYYVQSHSVLNIETNSIAPSKCFGHNDWLLLINWTKGKEAGDWSVFGGFKISLCHISLLEWSSKDDNLSARFILRSSFFIFAFIFACIYKSFEGLINMKLNEIPLSLFRFSFLLWSYHLMTYLSSAFQLLQEWTKPNWCYEE